MQPDLALPGFPRDFVSFVRCLRDGSELTLADGYLLTPADAGAVWSGRLTCAVCRAAYPIDGGILNLLDESALDQESANEQRQRNADRATVRLDTPAARVDNDMEMLPTLEALPVTPGCTLLELGSGDGRYTLALAGRAKVLAVDFSRELLLILQRRLPAGTRNVGLVLADINTLRVSPHRFDFALSTLTSNLPSREHRENLYRLARSSLAPQGRFVFSSHMQGIRQRLAGEPKSGYYTPGGIYRYHFDLQESIDEVRPHFARVHARPIQIHFPFARTLRLPVVWLSRMLERVPIVNMFGMLLLVVAEEPRWQG